MGNTTPSWTRRVTAVVGALAVTFVGVPPAHATPRPRNEEWWFSTWDVKKKVWPITTGRGITVAVLDGGINARLPDLARVVLPGTNLTGHKDDGRIDFDTKLNGHGTAMAALIAGQGSAMVGVAPSAKILPVTVFRDESSASKEDIQADGIRYATKHGAKVISMSTVGGSAGGSLHCDYYLQGAVDYAIKHDVVLVAGAGNDGDTSNPAEAPTSCPGVVGVGAVDYQARPWVKTERQPYVAIAAPGVDTGSIGKAGIFSNNSGTSTSTALAAGAVALIRAKFPKMSGREVVQRIIASALDTGPKGVDLQTGYGLLRPYHALTDKVPANAPNPVYARWDQAQKTTSTPAPPPSSSPSAVAEPDKKSGGSSPVPLVVGGVLLLCVLGGAGGLIARRKRGPGVRS
jgi:subtilisin family serine protease